MKAAGGLRLPKVAQFSPGCRYWAESEDFLLISTRGSNTQEVTAEAASPDPAPSLDDRGTTVRTLVQAGAWQTRLPRDDATGA